MPRSLARAGDRLAVEQHLARAVLLQPGEDADQRGLAAAGGPDHAEEFAAVDLEVDVAQRLRRRPVPR